MNNKFLTVLVFLVLSLTSLKAQKSRSFHSSDYTTAIGIKLYPGTGGAALSLKHFISKGAALEALATAWDRGSRATGLYEFHWDIPNAPGLKWYVGPGAHVGFYKKSHYAGPEGIYAEGAYVGAGVDGVIGLDYKFNKIPLNLSADWQPSYEFGSNRYNGFGGDFGGITARYTF